MEFKHGPGFAFRIFPLTCRGRQPRKHGIPALPSPILHHENHYKARENPTVGMPTGGLHVLSHTAAGKALAGTL